MDIKQTLTSFVIKEVQNHLDKTGESYGSLAKRCRMQPLQLKSFVAGVVSVRLETADRILKMINEFKK